MRSTFPRALLAIAIAALAMQAAPVQGGIARGSFHQTNLVSNIPGMANITDANLVNPWGLSSSATSPIWVADNGTSVSTLYNGAGQKVNLTVAIPAPTDPPGGPYTGTPTGTVFNGTTDFVVTSGTASAPSRFLFATEDGTILGWNPGVKPTTAVIAVNNSGAASYKGLTSGSVGTSNYLYAANFQTGHVDVFDGQFHPQTLGAGAFMDTTLPSGFNPFGIQNIGGLIYVTYALRNPATGDDVSGAGNGYVDVFTLGGALVRRLASGGTLNSPWGLAMAPASFGNFHNMILVGNFGDGKINAYTAAGVFRGQLKSETSAPIQIDGLWGLRFGNGGSGGDPSTLFFAAGINDEADGLYGSIQNVEG